MIKYSYGTEYKCTYSDRNKGLNFLNLFFNSPDQKFYVREISRTIDEQVNSVRRELTNLESVGVVKSSTEDRKIYYQANQRFKYYLPLRVILLV